MTMRQRKGIRAVFLTLVLLLLAVATFDSRNGFLVAQSESDNIGSDGNVDLWKAESTLSTQNLSIAQARPEIGGVKGVVAFKKVVEKEVVLKVEEPVEAAVEDVAKVVEYVEVPVRAKPTPIPRELPDSLWDDTGSGADGDDGKKGHGNDEPGPRVGGDGTRDRGNDESGPGRRGDRNKGHGNDEDRYDEDNPGRGGSGSVGFSRGRSDRGCSGNSNGRGKSSGRGGSKGSGKGRR